MKAPTTEAARHALAGVAPGDVQFRTAVFNLHVELLAALTAANFELGKAYGLGRALADTTREPRSLDALTEELRAGRVATLQAWLLDLASAFPPHAARPVSYSLLLWRDWAAKPSRNSGEDDRRVLRLARRQGERWRAVLSGEKQATDMLELQDYVMAGSDMLRRLGSLLWRFVYRFAPLLIFAGALFAGGVALILADSSAAHIAAGLGGLAASIGLTWKGAGTSLGKAMGRLERPLWEAALDREVTTAMTLVPGSKRANSYTPPGG